MSEVTLKQLLEVGAHFGHQGRRWNPAMKPYIHTEREGVHILDLVKTKEGLEKGLKFITETTAKGGVVLFLGTKRQACVFVKDAAIKVGMPFLSVRWVGGLLTNWDQISKRIRRLTELKERRNKGELKKYTKKEQLLFDREIARLERFLGGVESLAKRPDAIFIVDTHKEDVAVREANKMKIPVIGMVDTNADPRMVDYVIPINDDAVKSIELVINAVAEAVEAGRGVLAKTEKEDQTEQVAEIVEEVVEEKPKVKKAKKAATKEG